MKKFILEEIMLLSNREQRAKKVLFDPKTTIILGANDTGKSSLIKHIYWTFGAELPSINDDWKSAQVSCVVKFFVDEKRYILLRDDKFFALFDENSNLIGSYTSVTNELGPVLADIFDFKIKLLSRSGLEIVPPPAFYLLPFYVDQDSGWVQSWSSFKRLDQVAKWRKPLIEYHLGIKTNEYFEIKNQIDIIRLKLEDLLIQQKAVQRTVDHIKNDVESINLALNVESFKAEINELIINLKNLQGLRENFRAELVNYSNTRNTIENQIAIVTRTLGEVRADYSYASSHDEIDCPTCGHGYENSFADRFSIAEDENKCAELLAELNKEFINVSEKIDSLKNDFHVADSEVSNIGSILAKKKGDLTLHEVIESEGKRQLKTILIAQLEDILLAMTKVKLEQEDLLLKQKDVVGSLKEKKQRVIALYHQRMRDYLLKLDVQKLSLDSYKDVDCNINISGSDKPRALLAYYYSVLHVMHDFTSTTFAPIIIDSPNQQDQDKDSLKKMLEFIRDEGVSDSQLILGLTDTQGIDFGGKTITLSEKQYLLSKEEYAAVSEEINPLFAKSLLSSN